MSNVTKAYLAGAKQAYRSLKLAAVPSFKSPSVVKPPPVPKVTAPSAPKPPALQAATAKPPELPKQPTARERGLPPTPKLGEFNMGVTPPPRPDPDEIRADNGRRLLGTNFDESRPSREVSRAFDSLNIQRNHDVLNFGNEATMGSPGA